MDISEIIEKELRGSFDFFWHETPSEKNSIAYGLTRDNTNDKQRNFSSIAAVGFALAAYPLGVEKGWISPEEGKERALGTLKTFEKLPNHNGFFYHFYNIETAQAYTGSEISTIDTALFLAGALTSAEYFGGEIMEIFDRIYKRINWTSLIKPNGRFYMAFRRTASGYEPFGEWTEAAEQLMMYIFAGGSPTFPVSKDVFYNFERWFVRQSDYEYIRSYMNGIFVYQYSHAFIDFRGTTDALGVNWFDNSVNAAKAARQFAIDANSAGLFKTLGENAWGLSACLGPQGYSGAYGSRPNGIPGGQNADQNDGTLAVYGSIASMPFVPEEAKKSLAFYANLKDIWGKYGLYDSFNIDKSWVCSEYIGIDKGATLVMLANYQNEFVWNLFNRNSYIKAGMAAMGISKIE